MNRRLTQLRIAGLAVCLYAAWESRGLAVAWFNSPYDRFDFFAFLVWVFPVALAVLCSDSASPLFLCGALVFSGAGVVLDMNVLDNAGLAIALAAFIPNIRSNRAVQAVWLTGAVSWMPALGWFLNSDGTKTVGGLRMSLAVCTTAFLCRAKR